MKTPYIKIDLEKIRHNAGVIVEQCGKAGIAVAGVTKGTLGDPLVAEAMLQGGVSWIGESRLANMERLRSAGIDGTLLLMRSPHLSEIARVAATADISLNTELSVLRALSRESELQGHRHQVIVMVDTGDLREGLWPDELLPFLKEALTLSGIRIIGLGTNLTDLNGTIPTRENNQQLVELAEEAERVLGIRFEYLSAGNSSSQQLLASGRIPSRINHFRVGEGILLGRETVSRRVWPGTCQDAFVLCAEVIEKKRKPSVPIGELGQDAFGNVPEFVDKGIRTRCILNVGRQDLNFDGLRPRLAGAELLGATSDHLLLDVTEAERVPEVGEVLAFDLTYGAMLAAMTSPFVEKIYRYAGEDA